MTSSDRTVQGVAKTIAEVLGNKKYSIDYYQREYKWEPKQIAELVTDLTAKFLQLYEPAHSRRDVATYPGYFLGSIIISQRNDQPFVVDGQQRLTSLTLVLTYLRRLQSGRTDVVPVDDLIYSERFGERSFNLDVADRNDCMRALFDHGVYDAPPEAVESVRTLVDRYGELNTLFPDELRGDALPYFVDWLKDRVQLVQITAYNDDDAYAIFETMNDRGLKLTPADMLKGYLLANTEDGAPRDASNRVWRTRLRALDDLAEDASSDFLKTWLRSQYATKIRERNRGARPQDWDRIGTEFHRWLRGASSEIGLTDRDRFAQFVTRDLDFYSRVYQRLLEAAQGPFDPASPLRFVRFNSDMGFTLQHQMLLAPLGVDDDAEVVDRKLEVVGRFVDILLARRVWNGRATAYSTLQYAMFTLMRDIRGLSPEPLATVLVDYLGDTEGFDDHDELGVHQQNRSHLHRILARLTDFVSMRSGLASSYIELTNGATVRYEVEHVWANHPERHEHEFDHPSDFQRHRNRIGGLLLLPKAFNGSYNDATYATKLPHYFGQNLLAASLNPLCYERNPGFRAFVEASGLPFRPHPVFQKDDLTERGELYREIAKMVWNPDDLMRAAIN